VLNVRPVMTKELTFVKYYTNCGAFV